MKIIAHGGYSAKHPENSIESFKASVPFNPYAIEMDVLYDQNSNTLYCGRTANLTNDKGIFSKKDIENADFSLFTKFEDVIKKLDYNGKFLLDFKNPSIEAIQCILKFEENLQKRLILGVRDLQTLNYIYDLNEPFYFEMLGLVSSVEEITKFSKLGCTYIRLWEKDLDLAKGLINNNYKIWITPGTKLPRTAGNINVLLIKKLKEMNVDGVLVNDLELTINI